MAESKINIYNEYYSKIASVNGDYQIAVLQGPLSMLFIESDKPVFTNGKKCSFSIDTPSGKRICLYGYEQIDIFDNKFEFDVHGSTAGDDSFDYSIWIKGQLVLCSVAASKYGQFFVSKDGKANMVAFDRKTADSNIFDKLDSYGITTPLWLTKRLLETKDNAGEPVYLFELDEENALAELYELLDLGGHMDKLKRFYGWK